MLGYKVIREGGRLLAKQMHVVPFANQCPAQVLDVDVAARAMKHISVGH
jgi:hypothetical protein